MKIVLDVNVSSYFCLPYFNHHNLIFLLKQEHDMENLVILWIFFKEKKFLVHGKMGPTF
jgi:hypothetical protein